MLKKLFILISFSFLIISNSTAQTVTLKDIKVYDISPKLDILIDTSNKITFKDIQKPNIQKNFKRTTQKVPAYGYSSHNFWVKIEIDNQSKTAEDWVLHYNWNLVNKFIFYQKIKGKWIGKTMGQGLKFNERPLPYITYGLPLDLPKNTTKTIYIFVESTKPIVFPMSIKPKEAFLKFETTRNILYGLYFGSLIVMLLYNFFIWLFLRDRSYLYYVLIIISTLSIFSSLNGFGGAYLWKNTPIINLYIVKIMMCFIIITTILFANSFLQTKKYAPIFFKIFRVELVLAVIALIWTSLSLEAYPEHTLLKIHIFLVLGVGIMAWRNGQKAARFYVLAWTFYVIGGLGITFSNSGTLPINFFTRHSVEIGSFLEVVLLSLALSDRYRLLRKEKEAMTKELLKKEQEAKTVLEEKVIERTQSLQEANEELQQTNEELNVTLEMVNTQKKEIEEQRGQILASINYAKRIQEAILPRVTEIQKDLPDSFVFFKPRDIVSGDFYFYTQKEHKTIIAAVDCTGHGIPGAFMSLIGNDLLNEIINVRNITAPNQILNLLLEQIMKVLRQKENDNSDGMDIAICSIDQHPESLNDKLGLPHLEYAGAGNPLIYFQDDEMKIIKHDKIIIGGAKNYREGKTFTKHRIALGKPTTFYIFSDGIQDQFGGLEDRKFKPARLRQLLQEIHSKPMNEQHQLLEKCISDWQGSRRQLDDMLLIGVKISLIPKSF